MLVAQLDLQVEHLLAVALEPEVPRLDHARVDRADRDLVRLRAFDPEVLRHARLNRLRVAAPGVLPRPVARVEPDRLEPRVALGHDAPLLGQLPLEPVGLRGVRGQGRVVVADVGAQRRQRAAGRVADHGVHPHPVAGRGAEVRREEPAGAQLVEHLPAERGHLQPRDVGQPDRVAVGEGNGGGHGEPLPDRARAAESSTSATSAGMYSPRASTSSASTTGGMIIVSGGR